MGHSSSSSASRYTLRERGGQRGPSGLVDDVLVLGTFHFSLFHFCQRTSGRVIKQVKKWYYHFFGTFAGLFCDFFSVCAGCITKPPGQNHPEVFTIGRAGWFITLLLAVVKQDLEILLVGGHALSSSRGARCSGCWRPKGAVPNVHRTSYIGAACHRQAHEVDAVGRMKCLRGHGGCRQSFLASATRLDGDDDALV